MATTGFSTAQLDDASLRGTIKSAFRIAYEERTPKWKACGFEEDDTVKPFEEYTSFTGTGLAPRKEQFQQVFIDVPKQNFTKRVNLLSYAMMIPVSEEAKRFLARGSMNIKQFVRPAEMAEESISQTNEVLAADVFANAFSTTIGLGPDDVSLVNSAHVLGRGGTTSNYLGKVSLSQTGIEAAIIQGNKMPDDVGLPVGVGDGEHILVIPPDEEFNAQRILESTLQSDNANNAINTLKSMGIKVASNRYLGSTTNWFFINTKMKDGLIALFETKPEMKDFGDDRVGVQYFRAYEMVAFDWFNWRRVQGSDF